EQNVVTPVRIILELPGAAIDGTISFLVAQKDSLQSLRNLAGNFEEVHVFAGTRGALNLEIVAIELIEVEQASHQQSVDRHPNWSPPVGVSAEHAGVRLRGEILDLVFLVAEPKAVRVLLMVARERAYPVLAEEFVLVEHVLENAFQLLLGHYGEQTALVV